MENAEYDSSRPLAEQVAQKIKDYILEEKLKAGDKLPTETALAKEMGVARSTVREAIKRLESQNILTVRHGAGSFVTDQPGLADDPLGLDFIEDKERLAFDLLEVRNIIEPAIAALAAHHATPEQIAEMEQLYDQMEYHILHGQDYLEEDMKFHRAIAQASGNLVAPQLTPIITASVEVFTEGTHRTLLQETLDTPQGSAGGHQERRQHLGSGRYDSTHFLQPGPVPEDAPPAQRRTAADPQGAEMGAGSEGAQQPPGRGDLSLFPTTRTAHRLGAE